MADAFINPAVLSLTIEVNERGTPRTINKSLLHMTSASFLQPRVRLKVQTASSLFSRKKISSDKKLYTLSRV